MLAAEQAGGRVRGATRRARDLPPDPARYFIWYRERERAAIHRRCLRAGCEDDRNDRGLRRQHGSLYETQAPHVAIADES